jgi:hypothetical protein
VKSSLFTLVLALIAGVPAYAHHSFAAQYSEDQMVSIEGEVVEFDYRSPHAWVYIMAKNDNGPMQRYAAEWANPNRLARQGITKDTLKAGDYVILRGSPARNPGENKLHLKGIERPADGWKAGTTRPGQRVPASRFQRRVSRR